MNAKMLAGEFRKRGYAAQAWYLMNVASEPDHDDTVRIFRPDSPKGAKIPALIGEFFQAAHEAQPLAMLGFHPLANILGALACKREGGTFVGTQRNPADSQSRLTGMIERRLGSSSLYRANIAVSQSVADSYGAYPAAYRDRLQVIHNALPPLPVITESQAESRLRLGMTVDATVLGSLGRLADQKNIEFLIDVMHRLEDHHLYIAGEGPNEAGIRARIAALGLNDRVTMVGPLLGADVSRFYNAIDVFLMPSRFEGFGRTLIEALSTGTRTIATDMPVTREVSQHRATLLPLEASAWAQGIKALAAQTSSARTQMENEAILLGRQYTIERMVDQYLGALDLPLTA